MWITYLLFLFNLAWLGLSVAGLELAKPDLLNYGSYMLYAGMVAVAIWLVTVFVNRFRLARSTHGESTNAALRREANEILHVVGDNPDSARAEALLRQAYAAGDRLAGAILSRLAMVLPGDGAQRSADLLADCYYAVFAAARSGSTEGSFLRSCITGGASRSSGLPPDLRGEFDAYAQAGYLPAQLQLAQLLEEGSVIPADLPAALGYYEMAGRQGSGLALGGIGRILSDSRYARQDLPRALPLLEEASACGDQRSQLRLAELLIDGRGLPQDTKRARELLEQAAARHFPEAIRKLAGMLEEGIGGPEDPAEARRLLGGLQELPPHSLERVRTELLAKRRSRLLWFLASGLIPALLFGMYFLYKNPQYSSSQHDDVANIELREQAMELRYGVNQPVDIPQAEELLREAYRHNDKLAGLELHALLSTREDRRSQDEARRIWFNCNEVWMELTDSNDREAQTYYCISLLRVADDPDNLAFLQYALPRFAGSAYLPAILQLADQQLAGLFGEPDLDLAMQLYEEAATQGSICGTGGMGRVYSDPHYSGYDPERGRSLLEQAAAGNDPQAIAALAELYGKQDG
ncbi:MAG: sel1 repeat family protein [Planctomycetales bacterium]|nr:sel1 repeat family protein [bacterium]UNM09117.1 MAG: sel1 repeat family protein [Planctomycetales bacterium]